MHTAAKRRRAIDSYSTYMQFVAGRCANCAPIYLRDLMEFNYAQEPDPSSMKWRRSTEIRKRFNDTRDVARRAEPGSA